MKLFIINGFPESGKDTFVELVSKFDKSNSILNIHSSDFAKSIAEMIGWGGDKNEKSRKFIADLMKLIREYNDGVFNYYSKFILSKSEEDFNIFIHVREPEEIKKYVNKFNCKTIFVKRNSKLNLVYNNESDSNVLNYDYNIIILNNNDIESLQNKAFNFYKEYICKT
jgi:hypothetical protein